MKPRAILAVGAIGALAYGFPGYLNFDSAVQLSQARLGRYDDWHPPMMARYWRITDQFFHGPLPLFVLQIALFVWGTYGILRMRFSPRASAIATVLILWFPPVLAPMAAVWKDAQMAGWLVAGTMLLLRPSARARIGGIVMLILACAVRDNALAALPSLLFVAAYYAAVRGTFRRVAVAIVGLVVIAGTARLADAYYTDSHAYPWVQANAIHDIAGTLCYAPRLSDEEVTKLLDGVELLKHDSLQARFCADYNPRWWFALSYDDARLFSVTPSEAERAARTAAYVRLVKTYPLAFATHRWNVTRELLGLGDTTPDEPVVQSFAGSPAQAEKVFTSGSLSKLQRVVGRKFLAMSETMWFRPWVYLLIGLCMLGYAIAKRDGLVAALVTSGITYEASFALAAAGAPYRYSHWMIFTCCLAAVIVVGERYRQGRAR
ncbi:MAG: hypothetical protein QM831_15915 [Kofleriaceae bacterium]